MPMTAWAGPLFIFIWSTGFVVARYAMPGSEPMTFLSMRFFGVLVLMAPMVMFSTVRWPSLSQAAHLGVAGLLLHLGYVGSVWSSIKIGMPVGLAALIVSLQPVLTGLLAARMAERVSWSQWIGLALGLAGVVFVLWDRIGFEGVTWTGVVLCTVGLFSFTAGSLYQKRFCPMFDFRAGSLIQFGVCTIGGVILMLLFETMEVVWSVSLVGALIWSVLPVSIGAIGLWFYLLRKGEATRVSSYMYLTPATTAVMAWVLFDEEFTLWMVAGMLITISGVWLVTRGHGTK